MTIYLIDLIPPLTLLLYGLLLFANAKRMDRDDERAEERRRRDPSGFRPSSPDRG
jgi:hypothetical protein